MSNDGSERFLAKITPRNRPDGSEYSAEDDIWGKAGELCAARYFGVPINEEVYSDNRGDGGIDLVVNGQVIGVYTVKGQTKKIGIQFSHLIRNTYSKTAPPNTYVVVVGLLDDLEVVRWISHDEFLKNGEPWRGGKWRIRINKMQTMDSMK